MQYEYMMISEFLDENLIARLNDCGRNGWRVVHLRERFGNAATFAACMCDVLLERPLKGDNRRMLNETQS